MQCARDGGSGRYQEDIERVWGSVPSPPANGGDDDAELIERMHIQRGMVQYVEHRRCGVGGRGDACAGRRGGSEEVAAVGAISG